MSPRASLRIILASLALAGTASAAAFTMNPSSDAFVSSSTALNAAGSATISNSNYGAAGALAVSAAGLPKGEFDSLLRFDFTAAKASFDSAFGAGLWAITSMSLQLTVVPPANAIFNGNGAGPGPSNINFAGQVAAKWMQNDSWVEGAGTPAAPTTTGITFSTLPSFLSGADEALGSSSFSGATSGTTTLSLNLTTSFAADATAGNPVSLLLLPGDTGVAMLGDSQNFGTAALRPVLTVNASAVPEPGPAVLIATGALGWCARRRCHARKA